jgi:hypothetical protein
MKNIISFFGASVTQQKNGYAEHIKKLLNNDDDDVHIFGYGGNHINDAGICFIDNVINIHSNYCFVDFFSTAYTCINDKTIEYLDTIVYKLTNSNCKIIFLFMLNNDHDKRINFYNFVKDYINSRNLFYIDLNDFFKFDSNLIRDTVHTTNFGSEQYSEKIYDIFLKNKDIINYPINIVKTRFCENIKILQINKIFKDIVVLEGDCIIIAFHLIIGPKSGIVEIHDTKYSVWDQWCHYDRDHFNLHELIVKDKLEIKILQENIDYSECRRNITETDIIKELNIVNIYYLGNNLEIIN